MKKIPFYQDKSNNIESILKLYLKIIKMETHFENWFETSYFWTAAERFTPKQTNND